MTVNSVTGCKEVANLLHKCGHGISYADIRHLNKSWANEVTINTKFITTKFFQVPFRLAGLHTLSLIISIGSNTLSLEAKLNTTQMVLHFNNAPVILQN